MEVCRSHALGHHQVRRGRSQLSSAVELGQYGIAPGLKYPVVGIEIARGDACGERGCRETLDTGIRLAAHGGGAAQSLVVIDTLESAGGSAGSRRCPAAAYGAGRRGLLRGGVSPGHAVAHALVGRVGLLAGIGAAYGSYEALPALDRNGGGAVGYKAGIGAGYRAHILAPLECR